MAFRFETHLNVPIKGRMRGVTYEQAANYGILKDLTNSNMNIASVQQEGDKLVIYKRIDTKKNWWYGKGGVQKGFYERITIDRKEKSVAIDSFEDCWNVKTGPYVWRRDLFFHRDDEPKKLVFVRHLLWVNQIKRYTAQYIHPITTLSLKRKLNKY